MSTSVEPAPSPVEELTPEESRAFVEAAAQRLLSIGIDEFIRRLDAGEYDDVIDTLGNWQIGYLEDLARIVR
jgi:hypothetical protein